MFFYILDEHLEFFFFSFSQDTILPCANMIIQVVWKSDESGVNIFRNAFHLALILFSCYGWPNDIPFFFFLLQSNTVLPYANRIVQVAWKYGIHV